MGNSAKQPTKSHRTRPLPTTPEARENQMIALAINLAEKQLAKGTASSQVITHFLKLATAKEKIEKEILESKKELIIAKTDSIKSGKRIEELYLNALNAMRSYTGARGDDHGED